MGSVFRDDLFDGRLIDNLETSENDLGSEEGMAVKKKPKGLMFKIASRSKCTVRELVFIVGHGEIITTVRSKSSCCVYCKILWVFPLRG